jgi:hypothetical protein
MIGEAHQKHAIMVHSALGGCPDPTDNATQIVTAVLPSKTGHGFASSFSKLLAKAQLLECLGQRLFVIGEDSASANLLKLAADVLTKLECTGGVLALLRKAGIDSHLRFKVLTNSLFDSRVHKNYGVKIVEARYSPPGMALPLALKDLRLALAEADRRAVPMPAASLVHDRLVAMVARGWTDLDWPASVCSLPSMPASMIIGEAGYPLAHRGRP